LQSLPCMALEFGVARHIRSIFQSFQRPEERNISVLMI